MFMYNNTRMLTVNPSLKNNNNHISDVIKKMQVCVYNKEKLFS